MLEIAGNDLNRGRRFAVIAAVSCYEDLAMPALWGLEECAGQLRGLLRDEERQSRTPYTTLLSENRATRAAICEALASACRQAGDWDQLIFYFTGHGDRHGKTHYLLTSDSTFQDFPQTGLALDELGRLLSSSRAGQIVVILDCCFPNAEIDWDQSFSADFYGGWRRLCIITSTGRNQRAWADERGGYFSQSLLREMRSPWPNGLTADAAFERCYEEFKRKGIDRSLRPEKHSHGKPIHIVDPAEISRGVLPDSVNPFKGLEAFKESDAHIFFGREHKTRELRRCLNEKGLVVLVGESGSGKSSIIQAGLIPLLCRSDGEAAPETWRYDRLVLDREDPLRQLAESVRLVSLEEGILTLPEPDDLSNRFQCSDTALREFIVRHARPGVQRLLFFDQFEQVLVGSGEHHRDQLRRLLANLRSVAKPQEAQHPTDWPVHVVICVRADFYAELLACFGEDLGDFQVSLGRIRNLVDIIRWPLRVARTAIDDALLDRLLDDFETEPGNLPLLQFVLWRLWGDAAHQGRSLTLGHYRNLGGDRGGLAGVLNQYAEQEVLAGLDDEQRVVLQRIFLGLVTGATGDRRTGRLVRVSQLKQLSRDPERAAELIELLIEKRLLTTGSEDGARAVTISHERLLTGWRTLQTWLEEESDYFDWYEHFVRHFAAWRDDHAVEPSVSPGNSSAGSTEAPLWRNVLRGLRRGVGRLWRTLRVLGSGGLLRGRARRESWQRYLDNPERLSEEHRYYIRLSRWRAFWVRGVGALVIVSAIGVGAWMGYTRLDAYQIRTIESEGQALAETTRSLDLWSTWFQARVLTGNLRPEPARVPARFERVADAVLADLAYRLARIGRQGRAAELAALLRVRADEEEDVVRRGGILCRLAGTYAILDGPRRARELLDEVVGFEKSVPDGSRRRELESLLVQARLETGLIDLATAVAQLQGLEPYERELALQTAGLTWARRGHSREAAEVVRNEIETPILLLNFLAALFEESDSRQNQALLPLAKEAAGRALDQAEQRAERTRVASVKYLRTAILSEAGDVAGALKQLAGIESRYYRCRALAAVATHFVRTGSEETAEPLLQEATRLAASIAEDRNRSEAMASIARVWAQAGDFRRARLIAEDDCLAEEQLKVYSTILLEHAAQSRAELRPVLRELEE